VRRGPRRPQVAQTGDVLAGGIRRIILPRHSEAELEEVPPDLRQEMEFVLVDTAEEVLDHALESPPARARPVAASG
jgi:ATP-dependent Lon protease